MTALTRSRMLTMKTRRLNDMENLCYDFFGIAMVWLTLGVLILIAIISLGDHDDDD